MEETSHSEAGCAFDRDAEREFGDAQSQRMQRERADQTLN
jgi:hypothetical protein